MTVYACCRTTVVTAGPGATVMEIARLMEDQNVGSIVITEDKKPVGIVTDRDLVLRVITEERDPKITLIRDVMTPDPVCLSWDTGLFKAMEDIRKMEIRRFPVIDGFGNVCGIITIDDIIRLLAEELECVASIIEEES
jgi:CBS domain-containing protein